MTPAPAGTDPGRTSVAGASRPGSTPPRTEASLMRKLTLWAGLPAAATVLGVTLWFTLLPGRSGAG